MLTFSISLFFRSGKNIRITSLLILIACIIPALFSNTMNKNNYLALALSKDNVFSSLDNVLVDYQTALINNCCFRWS